MSERVSQTFLLCEDDAHAQLVRRYMQKCDLETERSFIPRIASRAVHGGNVKWVIEEFAKELYACRKRNILTKTLLIAVLDADNLEVAERRKQLKDNAEFSGQDSFLVLLIPRRNVETWIQYALNPSHSLNETDDYKKSSKKLDKSQFRAAANQIYDWVHMNPKPDLPDVPSLMESLDMWRRIG